MANDPRRNPLNTRAAELAYARHLRRLSDQVGKIIRDVNPSDPNQARTLMLMLRRYAEALDPWARRIAQNMIDEVNAKDLKGWRALSEEIGREITREITLSDQGAVMRSLLDLQVTLIKSIPIEAAERVQELSIKAIEQGGRAKEIAAEIMRSGEVTRSRAMTIARTEVSRAGAVLTQARAEAVKSPGYIWRTSRDGDVRPSHREMQGQFVAWNSPPTLDNMTGHAGCLPNCRCWAEIVIPEK